MNEKLLKILIYLTAIICLYAFVAIRMPPVFNAVLKEKIEPEYWENVKYGELYYFSFIRHFREEGLPPSARKYRYTDKHPALGQADVLLFGDSFFDFTRMTTFPERLNDTLHKRAFYARMDRPLEFLAENNFEKGEEKIFIYETAERYIPDRFTEPQPDTLYIDGRSTLRRVGAEIRDYIFVPESKLLYQTLLSRNYMTTDLFSWIATLRFDLFKYMNTFTPVYSLDEEIPWLFYFDQLNDEPSSFYYQHSQEEIDNYCDNIADLADKLYDNYNLEMVFMAIPSKYTINHTIVNNDAYNNFLPRIYEGLERRGVPHVPLYNEFMNAGERIYYGTDTHWNEKGLEIALGKTLDVLKTLNQKYFQP